MSTPRRSLDVEPAPTIPRIRTVPTRSLGNRSYLLSTGREAVVVDPPRDGWRLVELARSRGLEIRYVVETHVHNDYLTGAREVRSLTGATIVGPTGAGYRFAHRGVADGDTVEVGGMTLEALATPGHTPEHTAYLVYGTDQLAPHAVLTGGLLMDGTVGRTDLLGPDRTEELTAAQFSSLERLAGLPDEVLVLPTHDAGSFCSTGTPADGPASTLGEQRRRNPALRTTDLGRFFADRLAEARPRPAYYARMAPANLAGPRLLRAVPAVPAVTIAQAMRAAASGAWVVDGRDRVSFAAGHLPGAVNVELDADFATYVGCVVPGDAALVLVLPVLDAGTREEALTQLLRIGYDRVTGVLAGPWSATPGLRSYPVVSATEHASHRRDERLLDVREPAERRAAAIPGSHGAFVGDLPDALGRLDPAGGRIWTICASGRRAAVAASLLDRAGLPVGLVGRGGVDDWLQTPAP